MDLTTTADPLSSPEPGAIKIAARGISCAHADGSGADKADVRQISRRSVVAVINRRRRHSHVDGAAEEGFTLIEMMIALFVFALLASGFAVTMGTTLTAFQRSRIKTLGEQVTDDKLEDARRMPYDDLGDVGGNPIGLVPLTQTEGVGGYSFTVTTKVSYVSDAVPNMTATFADYKLIVVTATSATGAPPVTMSSLVAPPAKPAADKGRVPVTVNDSATNDAMIGISVDLVNGTTTRTDTSGAGGAVVFAGLPPSPNIPALTPTPGANDYYYLKATSPLPAGYYVYPSTDSSFLPAGANNMFQVAAATSVSKQLLIYKAASVSLVLTDAQGFALYDAATVNVTASGGLGSTGVVSIPAGGLLPAFSTVAGRGVIPKDNHSAPGPYRYTFDISAGGNCVKVDTPVSMYNPAYPVDTAFTLTEQLPCSYTNVNLHVKDAVDGSPIGLTTVVVTGGPVAGFTRTVTTDASGNASLRVQVETGVQPSYKVNIAAQGPRLAATQVTFMATSTATVVVPDVPVPWPTTVITATLKDGFIATNNVVGDTVNITGGPTAGVFSSTPATTNTSGQVTFTVPCGTPFAPYTLTVLPDSAGRLGIPLPGITTPSTCGAVTVPLSDPWAMMDVNITATDALTGLTFNGKTGTVTAGPAGASVNIPFTTDGTGKATVSVPAGPSPVYTLSIPAQSGHLAATTTFSPVGPGPVPVAIAVPGQLADLTVTAKGATTGLALPLKTVNVTGGPAGVVMSGVTNALGQVLFSVPTGLAPSYTISTPGGTASVSQAVVNTTTASLTVIGL